MSPDKYFNGHYLKNKEGNKKLGIPKVVWMGNFYFKSCILHNSWF